jgi:methyltransferase (TIGR00027 family)
MRTDGPSLTALGVAARRLTLERPAAPTGDPEAEARLARHLIGNFVDTGRHARGFGGWVATRTEFFDGEVVRAIADGVPQIVLAGAGYDGRALRFRTPGVRFFELDHPLTQHDKLARLTAVDARHDDITFAAADFIDGDVAAALAAAGHDASSPTLFTCEGVLRYLPQHSYRGLLATFASRGASGSVLAVSLSTREPGGESADDEERRLAREAQLAAAGEPVLTVPPRAVALEWVAAAGWRVDELVDTGRGRLLARAVV